MKKAGDGKTGGQIGGWNFFPSETAEKVSLNEVKGLKRRQRRFTFLPFVQDERSLACQAA
jgi:hypothetical protein